MKINCELSIEDFNAWGPAKDTKEAIINNGKVEEFDDLISEMYPDGIEDVQLNDILIFEEDWLKDMGILEKKYTDLSQDDNKELEYIINNLTDDDKYEISNTCWKDYCDRHCDCSNCIFKLLSTEDACETAFEYIKEEI